MGVQMFKEFEIPKGVRDEPHVERLVWVYQNLGNWSKVYYPLSGYTYLAPVLGLLAYDASDLIAKNLPELSIRATENFSNVFIENICMTFQERHFAIVVKSIAPNLAPKTDGKVVGGLALSVLLRALVFWLHKYKQWNRIQQMESATDSEEILHKTIVGSTKHQ
ncbi:Hypothetical predicted protein [Olea europaea subsp. europaea]|uniref:Uncharacterized protein n=1 Tax=Olea europaea subsp. europaea TaxID=158383 RepID=A0A8S0U093_OLEEU|nr:Hypothetical predicted protein [Olea europaea subsp. europaea]